MDAIFLPARKVLESLLRACEQVRLRAYLRKCPKLPALTVAERRFPPCSPDQADPRHYFAEPVSAEAAPDYAARIREPMCFQDVRGRFRDGRYTTVAQMAADIRLIATNAMTYNAPDTKYYRAAQRLLHVLEHTQAAVGPLAGPPRRRTRSPPT